jgi:hypothetical protein
MSVVQYWFCFEWMEAFEEMGKCTAAGDGA